jgi:16S rRNA (guanine966-N2)-methyltransferase
VFVDDDRRARQAVAANLAATGLADRARVVAGDALAALRGAGPFELVLLDPPYRATDWPALLTAVGAVVTPDAVVVVESDHEVEVPATWRVERRKRYGSTFVAIVRPAATQRPSPPEPP